MCIRLKTPPVKFLQQRYKDETLHADVFSKSYDRTHAFMNIFFQVILLILLSIFWFLIAALPVDTLPDFLTFFHPIGFYLLGLFSLGLSLVRMIFHLYQHD